MSQKTATKRSKKPAETRQRLVGAMVGLILKQGFAATTVDQICAAAGLTVVARAQPASATFRPALVDTFSSSYSYSAKGDLSRGSTTLGLPPAHPTPGPVPAASPESPQTRPAPQTAGCNHRYRRSDRSPG